jgi:hypothetical protein
MNISAISSTAPRLDHDGDFWLMVVIVASLNL